MKTINELLEEHNHSSITQEEWLKELADIELRVFNLHGLLPNEIEKAIINNSIDESWPILDWISHTCFERANCFDKGVIEADRNKRSIELINRNAD